MTTTPVTLRRRSDRNRVFLDPNWWVLWNKNEVTTPAASDRDRSLPRVSPPTLSGASAAAALNERALPEQR